MIIVAVSYDSASLNNRIQLLQRLGHVVVPTSTLDTCRKAIRDSKYHLLLIGATVSAPDRQNLANLSKAIHPQSKIVSVEHPGAPSLQLADLQVPSGDERALILAVTSVLPGDAESDLEERRR